MTTLDEKALKAVKDAAEGWEGTAAPAIAEMAVRAYLVALPPATSAWGIRLHNHVGGVAGMADYSEHGVKKWCQPGETPCQVEIREIRQP
jgi:hypothetical protein